MRIEFVFSTYSGFSTNSLRTLWGKNFYVDTCVRFGRPTDKFWTSVQGLGIEDFVITFGNRNSGVQKHYPLRAFRSRAVHTSFALGEGCRLGKSIWDFEVVFLQRILSFPGFQLSLTPCEIATHKQYGFICAICRNDL